MQTSRLLQTNDCLSLFVPFFPFGRKALMQDGPILLGMRIYQDFYAYESGLVGELPSL